MEKWFVANSIEPVFKRASARAQNPPPLLCYPSAIPITHGGKPQMALCKATGRLLYAPRHAPARAPFPGSSVVEQPAVNRLVAGSNPARGANSKIGD